MADEYIKTQWHTGDAITQDKMNHIEEGIAALNTVSQTVDTVTSSLNALSSRIGTAESNIESLDSSVKSISTQMLQDEDTGRWAAGQIHAATDQRSGELQFANLDTRFVSITNNIDTLTGIVDAHSDNLQSAVRANVNKDTLGKRFGDIERDTLALSTGYTALRNDINAAGEGYTDENNQPSLVVRLSNYGSRIAAVENEIDTANGNSTLNDRFEAIETELTNAHTSTAIVTNGDNTEYSSLDARLEADETKIVNLQTEKVNTNDIVDNLNQTDINKPLSAKQGNVIKQMLGTGVGTATGTTVVELIGTAQNNAINTSEAYTEELLGTGFDSTHTVAARLDAIDNVSTGAVHGLDTRISALETEVDMTGTNSRIDLIENEITNAHVSTVIRAPGENEGDPDTDTTYTSLDARLEAIESHAANVRADVNTIADELNMVNTQTGAIQDTNSRVDTIEANVVAMAKEIGMLQDDDAVVDLSTAVSRTNTKVDNIENEIDTAHRTINDTLNNRFDDVEYAISHTATQEDNTTGLTQRISELETEMSGGRDTYADIDARFDAVEATANAAAVKATVDSALETIDTRLDAIDDESTGAIKALQDADNDLDERLDAIDGGSALSGTVLATRVTNAESAISHVKDANDENDKGGLEQRMDAAEADLATKATTTTVNNALANKVNTTDASFTIIKAKSAVAYTDGVPNTTQTGWTPVERNDYLLQNPTDDKYYYWKFINNNWELISGAGGGGTGSSSGEFVESLAAITEPDYNVDYFVGTNASGYLHYRYIDVGSTPTAVLIGVDPENVKRYNIKKIVDTEAQKNYLRLFEYPYGTNNTLDDDLDVADWVESTPYTLQDRVIHDGYVYVCTTANTDAEWTAAHWSLFSTTKIVNTIELPQGGGGSSSYTTIKLLRITPQNVETIKNDDKIKIRAFYAAYDEETYDGTYTLTTGRTTISSGTLHSADPSADSKTWQDNTDGFYEFDVTDFCKIGSTTFTLTVIVNGETRTKDWTVKVYDLHIETNAPDTLLISNENSYNFPFTAFGGLQKTLHVLVDGTQIGTRSLLASTSGREDSYPIPAQSHGVHKVEMYLTATIDNKTQTTSSVSRDFIWYDVNDTETPVIIASPLRDSTITVQQYSSVEIPYQVYKKDAETITVKYYYDNIAANDESKCIDTVVLEGVNSSIIKYTVTEASNEDANTHELIPHSITIKVDNIKVTVYLAVTPLNINVSPISGAVIDFDPSMLTNSSANRLPTWTDNSDTYHLTVSDNFNWSDDVSGGGYKDQSDGRCFVIKAGSYVDLDYPMFKRENGRTVFDNGAEMKIIFKTAAVRDIDAVWFRNTGVLTEKTVGIQLNAHNGWLKTDKATNTTQKDTTEEYPTWESGHVYSINDIVVTKNVIYKYIKACVNNTVIVPGSEDPAKYWAAIAAVDIPEGVTPTEWITGTEYAEGDIVTYNDTNYQCQKDVINEITTNPKNLSDNWLKMGATETETIATNSYLYFPYSEEDKIELDININAYDSNADNNFIMSYEDGVPSKAYSYNYGVGGDGLYHNNTIRIGSDDCDVYIYRLRIYKKSLETDEILQNFIADGKNIDEKVARYNRNCIYWDETLEQYFTSPSSTAVLDPIKLAERMPDVKILMLDTPVFTVGKKNFVQNSTLRCIHASGGTIYESRGDEDNWFFQGGFHAGQGTTSDNYGQSARNVDFLFEVDGVHYPTKAKNMKGYTPSQDYKSSVLIGETASEWVPVKDDQGNDTSIYHWQAASNVVPEECDDWLGDKCKISLTSTSVPNNYFNLKVNVASSENVNNALFQKRYNDFLEYSSPAYAAQMAKHGEAYADMGLDISKIQVKNSMEFVPAVLFLRENDPDLSKHTEFNDTNWHFYALGNIGDSKKSDYTRAYDPDDMNEFTCENSDNNTNNGQFQSGVFMYNGVRAIETPYAAYDSGKTYKNGDIVIDKGVIKVYDGSNWINATLSSWTDQDTPYFAPYTAPNPMQYLYPISSSEWNVKLNDEYVNYKHNTLVNEEFDGDHSFEFRYGCCGDYRDGDLINDMHNGADKTQFNLNHDVMLAFYEWLITSSEEEYAAEAAEWFVPLAMEFFYAYTHYYTMMDNRAKNTFWHFAKTGKYRQVTRPFKELLHVYKVADGEVTVDSDGVCTGTFISTVDTEINPEHTYYTQYAFDLWVYDCDTAAGIDNNGALVFPYGKEDTDYRTEGDPASGYAFNGAGSIFWRRLRTTFADEITEVMNNADANCFNSEDLINKFDQFQECFPEEIWRLDIERKYIRTFTGASIDNSVTIGKQNPRFLTSMMQGRKKYQRRQWIRNQGIYFNSKYRLTNIISNDNTIEFNCTTPADTQDIALTPSYYLKLTPYQDMYLNVQVGNGNYKNTYMTDGEPTLRAKAGTEYTFDLSGNYQETRIYINGANYLSGIGNLAPMYPYSFDLRALAHIKKLNIGTEVEGYSNTKFTELVLPNYAPLLERLDIRNCHSIGGTINLSQASNIHTVEAEGTAITGVSLPDYTNIETLHLPSTVTAVHLYGARFIKDFKIINNAGNEDYSNLYTLDIYDSDYSERYRWAAENAYKVGDTVIIGMNVYECKLAHTSITQAQSEDTDTMNSYISTNWTLVKSNTYLPVNWIDIAVDVLEKKSLETRISLAKLSSSIIGDIQTLEPLASFKRTLEDAGGLLSLSGTIKVKGAWSTIEKSTYEDLWSAAPGLTLDTSEGTLQIKHSVTYTYENPRDGLNNLIPEKIYTTLYINDGDTAPDIYSTGVLTEIPTKAPTAQEVYEFGATSDLTNRYIPYSGWQIEGTTTALTRAPIITDNTVLETHFNSSPHTYNIKWYLHRNDPDSLVKTSIQSVPYGGGYDQEAPTVADIHAAGKQTCSVQITGGQIHYEIFKGWEKLPTNINPSATDASYNIYAEWDSDTTTISEMFASNNISNLTPAQLLTLSAMTSNTKTNYSQYITDQIGVGTRMTYSLGYNHESENAIEIVGPSSILRLDDNSTDPIRTDIQPLKSGSDAFTLVIDYCLNPNVEYQQTTNYGIIASCYYNNINANVQSGFAVYFDKSTENIRVGFGNIFNDANNTYNRTIGNASTMNLRNILVLRHPKGSQDLYIYSGFSSGNSLPSTIYTDIISYANFNSDSKLNIGALIRTDSSDATPAQTEQAKGTIYWAKYWPEDLGVGECKQLASWPHETMTYAITSLSNDASSRSQQIPSIKLATLNTSSHGRIVQNRVSPSTYSWQDAITRTLCNGRIFNSLPIELQAILYKTPALSMRINQVNDANFGTSYRLGSALSTNDYLYAYSAANVSSSATSYSVEDNLFNWLDTTNRICYNYNNNSWVENANDSSTQYLNIRFPNKAITWGASSNNKLRIFKADTSVPGSSVNIAYSIEQAVSGGIRSGDIYIENSTAYIYVLNSEVAAYGYQVKSAIEDSRFNVSTAIATERRGQWIEADEYWTRSLIADSQQGTNFGYVRKPGELDMSTLQNLATGRKISYIMAL